MSDLRVAVLGLGLMGSFHTELLTTRIRGVRVAVVNDFIADEGARRSRLESVPGWSPTRSRRSRTRRSTRCCWPPPAAPMLSR